MEQLTQIWASNHYQQTLCGEWTTNNLQVEHEMVKLKNTHVHIKSHPNQIKTTRKGVTVTAVYVYRDGARGQGISLAVVPYLVLNG